MKSHTKLFIIPSLVVLFCIFMTGCASFTVSSYGVSIDNVMKLKEYSDGSQKISVGQFTAAKPDQKSIFCRGAGDIKIPGGHSFESYIREALINELKLAELYSPNSITEINGFLDDIDMSSGPGSGKWKIRMTFSTQGKEIFSAENIHSFSSHWVAEHACQKVAQEFVTAVQEFIKVVIEKQEFQQLIQEKI